MAFEKDQSAGYLINHLARLCARGLAARLAPLGLSIGTFPALLELWAEDGLTQKALVKRLDIEQATMANTLARMERDGLIARTRDAGDGRAQRVWLTARAQALRSAAEAAAHAENSEQLKGLGVEDREVFLALMRRILHSKAGKTDAG